MLTLGSFAAVSVVLVEVHGKALSLQGMVARRDSGAVNGIARVGAQHPCVPMEIVDKTWV